MAYDPKFDRLIQAVQYSSDEEIMMLFKNGQYSVNEEILYIFQDRKQYTVSPLYLSVVNRRVRVCRYLLQGGAKPFVHLVYEYYPLHEACSKGYDDIVHEFVAAKCNLNVPTSDHDTPLHIACMRGHIPCVSELLRAGADSSIRNCQQRTPLEEAVYHNHHELVKLFEAFDRIPHQPKAGECVSYKVTVPPCS